MNQINSMEEWSRQVWKHCLSGNIREAYQLLEREQNLSEEWQRFREDLFERFFAWKPTFPKPPIPKKLQPFLDCYFSYLSQVLLQQIERKQAEEKLAQNLSMLVKKPGSTMEELEGDIKILFEKEGFHFLGGKTEPFYGPYIWTANEEREYEVEIPLGKQRLKVIFMHGFILRGWLDFATCGRRGAGGWAKKEELYCVYEAYKDILDSSKFQVSYLKHEAQHADDFKRFPGLKSFELEYRAKLVELIYEETPRIINQLIAEADQNPDFPHHYSSYLIVEDIEKLSGIPLSCIVADFTSEEMEKVRLAAKRVFLQHTASLEKRFN
ncbi:MAG TPA: hypothetical protein VNM69_12740 [Bacillus sp. (in: firmicutes)]|uniref:hypothetical protein n=1 Tax=Bacillus litorisediminis TaxID=2922713 RepID=UPI001FAF4412|nr:hypothetical protein [Bacillus litorisediminis]HWO76749.1 hypothetical protein [Bacillus sp. (in: firmicutes)]